MICRLFYIQTVINLGFLFRINSRKPLSSLSRLSSERSCVAVFRLAWERHAVEEGMLGMLGMAAAGACDATGAWEFPLVLKRIEKMDPSTVHHTNWKLTWPSTKEKSRIMKTRRFPGKLQFLNLNLRAFGGGDSFTITTIWGDYSVIWSSWFAEIFHLLNIRGTGSHRIHVMVYLPLFTHKNQPFM